jgi:adenosylmethionine-8-amino-7-oxononanoate aminotransferase
LLIKSGSEGIEAAQKLAIQYHAQEKPKSETSRIMFIARDRSYHGATMGALAVSGHTSRREIFKPVLSKNTNFFSPCNPYRDLKEGMTNDQYVQQLAQELDDKI